MVLEQHQIVKVLFVSSGNRGLSPIVKNQGDSLSEQGIEVEYYTIKGKGLKGYLRNISPLRKKLRSGSYDVVHAHYSMSGFVASLAGAHPLVVSLMGSDVKQGRIYKSIINFFAKVFHWRYVIVKSEDMSRSLGMKNVEIIPNGVNCNRFIPMNQRECQDLLGWNPEKRHILFPSNPARYEKNYPLLEAALRLLDDDSIEVHCLVNIPNEQTPIWYNAADVVVMTSLWEGSPNAIKESMACCRPIVTTRMGDVERNLAGLGGCYIVGFDGMELSQKIREAIDYNKSTNGEQQINKLGLSTVDIARKILNLYSQVLN